VAYRAPFFLAHHALRLAGDSAVTITGAAAAGFAKTRLLDSRHDAVFRWSAAQANHAITLDRGAGFAALPALDHFIIPSGHNFAGASAEVQSDDNSGFTSPTTRWTGTLPAGLVSDAFATSSSERYLRLIVSTSGQWELAEFMPTVLRTPSTVTGPDPEYDDDLVPNYFETTLRSGNVYRLELGDDVREFAPRFRALTTADRATLDTLWTDTARGLYPLWYGPPDDAEPVLPCHLVGEYRRKQDSPNPIGTGLTFDVALRLREVLS